jgi:hypothetical protein
MQHAPSGLQLYEAHVLPAGPGLPPAARQFDAERLRQPPVDAKQHATGAPESHVVAVQAAPSPR